ncbi:MAG TPA: response regulator, partial [Chitinophagaceae bacterium]
MSKRVIIFDDDPDILNICSIILTARGYQVATNTSCDNLLEAITEFEPNVIVMDNKIPAIGGV